MKTSFLFSVFLFLSFQILAQNNRFQNDFDKIDQLNLKGEYSQALDILDSILDSKGITSGEKIEVFDRQYEIERNRSKTKRAKKAILKSKQLKDSLGLEYEFEFKLNLLEIYFLRRMHNEYDQLYPEIEKTIYSKNDYYSLGRFYFVKKQKNDIDEYHERRSYLKTAIDYFDQCEEVHPYYKAHAYRELGNKCQSKGDFDLSMSYYRRELEICEKFFDADHIDIGICNFNMANIYYEKQNFQSAVDHYNITYRIWSKRFKADGRWMMSLNEAMGDMHYELGNDSLALLHYNQTQLGSEGINLDPTIGNIQEGDSLLQKGLVDQAVLIYNKAYERRVELFGQDHFYTGVCKNYYARALSRAGNKKKSLRAYQDAIDILVLEMDETSIYDNPNPEMKVSSSKYLIESLIAKAQLMEELFQETNELIDLETAYETYKLVFTLFGQLNSIELSEDSRAYWIRKTRTVYEDGIKTGLVLYDFTGDLRLLAELFAYSEQNKALLLAESIRTNQVNEFANVPKAIVERENELSIRINDYSGKIESELVRCDKARSNLMDLWKYELLSLKDEQTQFLSMLKSKYPNYYKLKYDFTLPDLGEIRSKFIQEDDLYVSYFWGENSILVFAISDDTLTCRVVDDLEEVRKNIVEYRELISRKQNFLSKPQKSFESYNRLSYELYLDLISNELQRNKAKNLIISTDGLLSYLPFESLIKNETKSRKRDYLNLDYLLYDYSIGYCQSAKIGVYLSEVEMFQNTYIGLAPDYSSEWFTEYSLGILNYNQKEVVEASDQMSGESRIQNTATESWLKEHSKRAGILHLAAHGDLEDEHSLLSKIYLNPSEEDDGVLHMYEIYNMKIPAELVVLSACNTGTGELAMGEGIMSLERAFQYAGSRSILSTLWSADDQSSLNIVTEFLSQVQKGKSKSESLRQAKIAYLKNASPEVSNPFYWANFRISGNNHALNLNKDGKDYMWWVLLFLSLFAGGFYFKRKLSK